MVVQGVTGTTAERAHCAHACVRRPLCFAVWQSGKFDAPDRLFNSLRDSWESATSSTTDVKELTPEFFMPGEGDMVSRGVHALWCAGCCVRRLSSLPQAGGGAVRARKSAAVALKRGARSSVACTHRR
jgi:hypothetical protein